MGNCLRGEQIDSDLSLIPEDESHSDFEERNSYLQDVNHSRIENQSSNRGQIFHPVPGVSRTVEQLTEEEQIRIAKRLGLIEHLPTRIFQANLNEKVAIECIICMSDYVEGELLRVLPCMHAYHKECIDDWLRRSFTCPSCLQAVDSALLASFNG